MRKFWAGLLICSAAFAQEHRQLTVAAAANLTDVFGEVAAKFKAKTGVDVVYSFGATANLTMQVEHAAPFDVFAAADVMHIDQLEKEGLLTPGTRAVYARGRLALWQPGEARVRVMRMEDLKNPEVKLVAIANPKLAPYGAAAVETLKKTGLWPAVEPKVVYSENISAAKQFASTGNADVAFTAYSLVIRSGGTAITIPEEMHTPINQAMGVVKASPNQAEARQFEEFVLGEEGRAILARYGYGFGGDKGR